MDVDSPPHLNNPELNPSIFNDPHFLAAAHTFQDHMYSNWLSDGHAEKVRMFQDGIRDGSLAAPWKDEVWERDHPSVLETPVPCSSSSNATLANEGGGPESGARAGYARSLSFFVSLPLFLNFGVLEARRKSSS